MVRDLDELLEVIGYKIVLLIDVTARIFADLWHHVSGCNCVTNNSRIRPNDECGFFHRYKELNCFKRFDYAFRKTSVQVIDQNYQRLDVGLAKQLSKFFAELTNL